MKKKLLFGMAAVCGMILAGAVLYVSGPGSRPAAVNETKSEASVSRAVMYRDDFQPIKGWGAYPSYYRTDWDRVDPGKGYQIFDKPEAQRLLYQELGMSIIRTDIQPRFYDPGAKDLLNTAELEDMVRQLQSARQYGIKEYAVSIWSPPAVMKNTGALPGHQNKVVSMLLPEKEDEYVRFIVNVFKYLDANGAGLPLAFSLQNEPGLAPEYDGCVYGAGQYQRVCKKIRKLLDQEGLQKVTLIGPESETITGSFDTLGFGFSDLHADKELNHAIGAIAFHSYDHTSPEAGAARGFEHAVRKTGKELWMTEWSPSNMQGKLTKEIDYTLLITRHLARDIGSMPVNYWFYWLAYQEKTKEPADGHGSLVYGDAKTKSFRVLQTLWKNAPAGSIVKRFATDDKELQADSFENLDIIGFKNPKANTTTILLTNRFGKGKRIELACIPGSKAVVYQTTETEDMAERGALPVKKGSLAVTLPPKSVTIVVTNASKPGWLTPKGAAAPQPVEIQPVPAVADLSGGLTVADQPAVKPQVDGELSEKEGWNAGIPIQKQVFGIPGVRASFGTLCDGENLYIGVKVMDSNKVTDNESNAVHYDDCIEIFLNGDGLKQGKYKSKDRQFMIRRDNTTVCWQQKDGKADNIASAVKEVEGGYTAEVAIPLEVIGVSPVPGARIGFDIAIDDDMDGGARDSQIMWHGSNSNYDFSMFFGSCELANHLPKVERDSRKGRKLLQTIFDDAPAEGIKVKKFGKPVCEPDQAHHTEGGASLKVGAAMRSGKSSVLLSADSTPFDLMPWKDSGVISLRVLADKLEDGLYPDLSSANILITLIDEKGVEKTYSELLSGYMSEKEYGRWKLVEIPVRTLLENNPGVSRMNGVGVSIDMNGQLNDVMVYLDDIAVYQKTQEITVTPVEKSIFADQLQEGMAMNLENGAEARVDSTRKEEGAAALFVKLPEQSSPVFNLLWKDKMSFSPVMRQSGALRFSIQLKPNDITYLSLVLYGEGSEGRLLENRISLGEVVTPSDFNTWKTVEMQLSRFSDMAAYWDDKNKVMVPQPFDWQKVKGVGIAGWTGTCRAPIELWLDDVRITKYQAPPEPVYIEAPSEIVVKRNSGGVPQLTWKASATDGVAGYSVFRDHVKIADIRGTSFEDTEKEAGGAHVYRIKAYDAKGNLSGFSREVLCR